jgi:aminomethyltransferase
LLARTGYTGEDGFEIYIPVASAGVVMDAILAAGKPHGLLPTGLACRDTLRLEAGMPLYGHEMNLEINPYEAGFGKVVRLDKSGDFVGKAALVKLSESERAKVLVGVAGEGKRAARSDYEVFVEGSDKSIGYITSGALSPTLGFPIAMAYVSPDFAQVDTPISVDIRGTQTAFRECLTHQTSNCYAKHLPYLLITGDTAKPTQTRTCRISTFESVDSLSFGHPF